MSIKIDNVNYIYNPGTPFEVYALKDINLEIADGSFVAIIGQTGSGKSTLIQHINGLILPSTGSVIVNNLDTKDKKARKKIRQQVGVVFQYPEHQLFEETVYKDIAFGPKNMGTKDEDIDCKVREALHAVGLSEDFLEKSPFDLSGGQMRRVAIAGVLAMNPQILVLDEPTAGLDPRARREILAMVNRLQTELKITIIIVTHDMEEVASLAHRVIVMHNSQVVLDGPPTEIFKNITQLRSIGLDAPPITILFQQLRKRGWQVPEVVLTVEEASNKLTKAIGVDHHAN